MEDKELTTEQRKKLKSSTFCGPGRSFPVPDCAHYTAALRLLNRAKVSESTRSKIRACVMRKGENMGCGGAKDSTDEYIESLIGGETFDETHDMLEFIQMLEDDQNFQVVEDQKLRIIQQIIAIREQEYGKDTTVEDYTQRSFSSLLDTLLDEVATSQDDIILEDASGFQPPEGAKNNAQRVLNWKREYGSEVKGMTSVGWGRARQLATGRPIGLDTVSRMAQFNRHRKNAAVAPEYKGTPWKDAGHVAWLGWGGTTGVDWAIRTMEAQKNK
jgi:hypothetical protein